MHATDQHVFPTICRRLDHKFVKVADVYDESKLNGAFIHKVNQPGCNSLPNYKEMNKQTHLTDTGDQEESFLIIQKMSRQYPITKKPSRSSSKSYYKKHWGKCSTRNKANMNITNISSCSSRRQFKPLPVAHDHCSSHLWSNQSYTLSFSFSMVFVTPKSRKLCYNSDYFASRCPLLANLQFVHFAIICSTNTQKKWQILDCKPRRSHRTKESNHSALWDIQNSLFLDGRHASHQ